MARYTKIPEIDFAGALSTSLGGLAGTVIAKAEKTLLSSRSKLSEMAIAAFKESRKQAFSDMGCLSSYNTLSRISNGLSTVSSSYSTIISAVNAMKVTVETLMIPVEALEAAILVIKMIPLPQMYLVVSITTVFSDTLEMLSELVAQTKEIVDSASELLNTITRAFDPIKLSIDKVQSVSDTLKADQLLHCALSTATDEDIENLQRLGIIDSLGDSIFNKLGQDAVEKGYISFGNVEEPSKDTLGKLNYLSKSKQSGANNLITLSQNIPTISLNDKNLFGVRTDGSDAGTLDGKILLITSTSDIYTLLSRYLSELDDASYIGSEIKEIISNILNNYPGQEEVGKDSPNNPGIEFYKTPSGELLTLEVVKDKMSPKIATRHYAIAKTQNGVVILEGIKSFTLNPKQLIEDLKLRLSQLFV